MTKLQTMWRFPHLTFLIDWVHCMLMWAGEVYGYFLAQGNVTDCRVGWNTLKLLNNFLPCTQKIRQQSVPFLVPGMEPLREGLVSWSGCMIPSRRMYSTLKGISGTFKGIYGTIKEVYGIFKGMYGTFKGIYGTLKRMYGPVKEMYDTIKGMYGTIKEVYGIFKGRFCTFRRYMVLWQWGCGRAVAVNCEESGWTSR